MFDGPPWLYAMTGQQFLSPLVFPQHLNSRLERNVSHLDTDREIGRILAGKPGVVVMSREPSNEPVNLYAARHVRAYIAAHCRHNADVILHERAAAPVIGVYGDCR